MPIRSITAKKNAVGADVVRDSSAEELVRRIGRHLHVPWSQRPLESDQAMVFIDSLPLRIGEVGRLMRLHLALGISRDGSKAILDYWISHPDDAGFWSAAMQNLKARGMRNIKLAVVENHAACAAAVRSAFPRATVIANIRLAIRASLEFVPRMQRTRAAAELCRFFATARTDEAVAEFVALDTIRQHPSVEAFWRDFWSEASEVLALPPAVRRLICSTDAVESMTEKLRRRGHSKRRTYRDAQAVEEELLASLRDGSWHVSAALWLPAKTELLASSSEQH